MVGHDFLLLHTAVVLQGDDNWVIGRLGGEQTENKEEKAYRACADGCVIILDITGYLTHLKRILLDGSDGVFEEDLGGECVAVVDHWLIV